MKNPLIWFRGKSSFLEQAKKMLVHDEGFRAKPYKDTVGKITIGVGYNLSDRGLEERVLYELLEKDIVEADSAARRIFENKFDAFSDSQKLAVVNMIFNLGEVGFLKFKQTISYIKDGAWEMARASALKSKWAKQVGNRAGRVTDLFLNKVTDYKF